MGTVPTGGFFLNHVWGQFCNSTQREIRGIDSRGGWKCLTYYGVTPTGEHTYSFLNSCGKISAVLLLITYIRVASSLQDAVKPSLLTSRTYKLNFSFIFDKINDNSNTDIISLSCCDPKNVLTFLIYCDIGCLYCCS